MDGQGDGHPGQSLVTVGRDVMVGVPRLAVGRLHRACADPEQAGGAHLPDGQGDERADGVGFTFDADVVIDTVNFEGKMS